MSERDNWNHLYMYDRVSAQPDYQITKGEWYVREGIPFENTPENAREILANLGRNIDVIGGIFDETMLEVRGCG